MNEPFDPDSSHTARLIIVMGVSGSGKSTVGERLAEEYGVTFIDGDHLHPAENVEKMRGGTPLTDEDRWPWLKRIAVTMLEAAARDGIAISGCSALKRAYRDYLRRAAGEPVRFVHLDGSKQVIAARQANRPGHFMPAGLLDSQFATLEMPAPDEQAITVSVEDPVDQIVAEVRATLASQRSADRS